MRSTPGIELIEQVNGSKEPPAPRLHERRGFEMTRAQGDVGRDALEEQGEW
jgi:hypothetical protein